MSKKYLAFRMYGDDCAVSLHDVLEILQLDELYATTNKSLRVAAWNHRTIPVIDPISILSIDEHKPTMKSRILVLRKKGIDFGLLVEETSGFIEVPHDAIDEPSISEQRYVQGMYGQLKIIDSEKFITKKVQEKCEQIGTISLEALKEAESVLGIHGTGRDALLESARLKTLNWTIKAAKANIDEKYIQEAMSIHEILGAI